MGHDTFPSGSSWGSLLSDTWTLESRIFGFLDAVLSWAYPDVHTHLVQICKQGELDEIDYRYCSDVPDAAFQPWGSTPVFAQSTYEITIYNLSQNQVLTPRGCELQWSYGPLYGGPTCNPWIGDAGRGGKPWTPAGFAADAAHRV